MFLLSLIFGAVAAVAKFVIRVIIGVLNFVKNILEKFCNRYLNPNIHTPFMGNAHAIKGMLKNAPVRNVGIFTGLYNHQTEQIEELEVEEADQMDQKTKKVLGNEPLVILN